MTERETSRISQGNSLLLAIILVFLLAGCASASKPPDWVTSARPAGYPEELFLLGVGQGDSRPVAEERAYAALARIFKADVTSQSKDWESYRNLESRGSSSVERRLTLETITKVSTDKVLENVSIAETWRDPASGLYSALAVMNRSAARAAFAARMADLDDAIARDLTESRGSADKFVKLRGLRRALKNLMIRNAYQNDLHIIAGAGATALSSPYSASSLAAELKTFRDDNLIISVEVSGEQAAQVRRSLIERLVREGFPVSEPQMPARESPKPDLVIQGIIRLWPADFPDPKFRYVRWCADFMIRSQATDHVVGVIARAGREGHLTYREASERALRTLQQEVSSAVVKNLADQIYGEAQEASSPVSSVCSNLEWRGR